MAETHSALKLRLRNKNTYKGRGDGTLVHPAIQSNQFYGQKSSDCQESEHPFLSIITKNTYYYLIVLKLC